MISAGAYRFGSDSGQLLLRTFRTGLGSRAGHDLLITARSWSGTATVEPGAADAAVTLTVQVDSLEVVEGHGGIKPLTEGDRAEIRKTMLEKVLDARRHPVIEFRSTAVRGSPEAAEVTGELSIRGASRPVTVRGSLAEGAEGPRLRAGAQVVQSEWGVKPYTAFLGALKLRDAVDVEVEATLVPAGPAG